jgi:hypothetical protein
MTTPNQEKMPAPTLRQDWYELRMHFLGRFEVETAFFKSGCHTAALNEARKRAKAKNAFHFDISLAPSMGEQLEA